MIDIEKYNTLAAIVREARETDRLSFQKMEAATADWKAANAVLTDRMKVFDGYIAQCKAEDISVEGDR
jgi:hypothetical protein